jgi:hypothetical protein
MGLVEFLPAPANQHAAINGLKRGSDSFRSRDDSEGTSMELLLAYARAARFIVPVWTPHGRRPL